MILLMKILKYMEQYHVLLTDKNTFIENVQNMFGNGTHQRQKSNHLRRKAGGKEWENGL